MAKVICLAQQKGGTSKTSSVLNLSACLVQAGYKVLAVDVDQQASLTVSLGVDLSNLKRSMQALLTEQAVAAEEVIVKTEEGIDLIPANVDLAMVEFQMPSISRERVLARKLHPLKDRYDFILIDTPPSFAITTLNAMVAAEYLLVPVQPEPLCLLGMSQLTKFFQLVQQDTNPHIRHLGVFIALYDGRSNYHKEITKQIREDWGDLAFQTVIRRRMNILEATLKGQATTTLAPNSEVAQDYQALTKEILARV